MTTGFRYNHPRWQTDGFFDDFFQRGNVWGIAPLFFLRGGISHQGPCDRTFRFRTCSARSESVSNGGVLADPQRPQGEVSRDVSCFVLFLFGFRFSLLDPQINPPKVGLPKNLEEVSPSGHQVWSPWALVEGSPGKCAPFSGCL